VLSVEEIEAHLGDKFRFLAFRRPAGDPRHQALRATIDWSYQLLPAAEQDAFRQLSVFAGGFGLAQAAAVCWGGDLAVALDLVDRLAGKSLIVAETAEGRTRYRLLDTIRQYAAGRLAEAGEADPARRRHAEAFLVLAGRERDVDTLAREQDNFRAALDWSLAQDDQAGPRLARALGRFWLARGFLQEGRGWLERALAAHPPDSQLRADLHRNLGAILYQVGEQQRAESALTEGAQIAAASGLAAAQARISVVRAEIRVTAHGADAESLSECEAAAAVLEADGDLDGLAEAWFAMGILRGAHNDPPQVAFERAIRYARESGNHRVNRDARGMLLVSYLELPIPADVAIARAEQFLGEAGPGDPWWQATMLEPSSVLYAYAGRFADARSAIARAQSLYRGLETKLTPSCALCTGEIELVAGSPAAAEPELRKGCQGCARWEAGGFFAPPCPGSPRPCTRKGAWMRPSN
jgi:tetratricopeptide (TPR) repeat protein